jgi:hypothetical protein
MSFMDKMQMVGPGYLLPGRAKRAGSEHFIDGHRPPLQIIS